MRASDLIGHEVVDEAGHRVGVVTDVRCVQDGPLRGTQAALRVDSLLISRHHRGSSLGYHRAQQQGPLVIAAIVRRLHRRMRVVPWADVADAGPPIRLRPGSVPAALER